MSDFLVLHALRIKGLAPVATDVVDVTRPEHTWMSAPCRERHCGPANGSRGMFPSTTILLVGT